MTTSPTDHNRLANASSPYLRQHAGNPVDWQPWDDAALRQARATDTPILLSIGYSACHWCHVMAHECFENPAIAAAMNASFVNIKLDREERPDIDRVYQLAHQAMSGRGGGWPLTAFLDPQTLAPFYVGTYFPSTPKHGLPGFPEVLARVRDFFAAHRDELRGNADELQQWLERAEAGGPTATVGAGKANAEAMQHIASRFDAHHGGTVGAPKFPRAAELEWLLDVRSTDDATRRMTTLAVRNTATRGLQDHLGGGFFRYCVDADWTIPHFEKMLYDNAQLLPVYARVAADAANDQALRDIAAHAVRGIATWLAEDMATPDGAFCSALDADSEGEEGKFYLWTREQLRGLVPEATYAVAAATFGLDQPANFDGRAWHLLRAMPLAEVATKLGLPVATVATEHANARRLLLVARNKRTPPVRDDKILTAWNALAIGGLARSARMLDDARCTDAAVRALATLHQSAWIDGELFANAAEPAARIPGFLDDHAFLLDALLEVLQLDFDRDDLDWAVALANTLCDRFADPAVGGFWFSTARHATPLARSRVWTDDALPSGNGVAIRALLRLGHLVGDTRYLAAAERALRAGAAALQTYPEACPTLLRALAEFERPRMQIVVRCAREQIPRWRDALNAAVRGAHRVPGGDAVDAFIIPTDTEALSPLLATREARGTEGTAYVCSGLTCRAPVDAPGQLADAVRAASE